MWTVSVRVGPSIIRSRKGERSLRMLNVPAQLKLYSSCRIEAMRQPKSSLADTADSSLKCCGAATNSASPSASTTSDTKA